MNLHDIYSLATRLPGSWLLNKSTLDNAIEHVPYEEAHRVAALVLYDMIQENLEKDNKDYKDSIQQILQQLTSDPEISDAIKAHSKKSKASEGYDYGPTGIANPAEYMSSVTIEKDTDGDGDTDIKVIKNTGDNGSYW